MKNIKELLNKIEGLGWEVDEYDNDYTLQQYSPLGQDFSIAIQADNVDDFIKEIYNRYENFDCSYETYIWLDDKGHGVNGAPYDMKDLYEDMEK